MVKGPDILGLTLVAIILGVALSLFFDRYSKRKCSNCNGEGCEGCHGTGEEMPIVEDMEYKIPCSEEAPPLASCPKPPCPYYQCQDGYWELVMSNASNSNL